MPPRWNEPSSETWSSAGPTHAGKPSRGAVRMPRPIMPRTTRPSAEPWSRRTRSRVTSALADHSRGRAFRAPLPPKSCQCGDGAVPRPSGAKPRYHTVALLHVEPGRNPYILDVKHKPQQHLDRQRKHREHKKHHDRILQQAHALVILRIPAPEEAVQGKPADHIKAAHHHQSEDCLDPVGSNSEKVRQIAVHLVDEPVVVPRLSGPEPLPSRAANKGPDDDHRNPQHDKTEQE